MVFYNNPTKDIFLKPGQRALILGATGSGKSVMMQEMARQAPNSPVIVMDTKGDDGFLSLNRKDESLVVVENFNDFKKILKQKRSKIPDYIVCRPNADEMVDPVLLDGYLMHVYNTVANCYVVVDEASQLHAPGGRALPGLINLLTRGRAPRNISTIIGSQRPAFISLFCYSEVTKIIVYRINNKQDRKRIADLTPYPIDVIPQQYHFFYYEVNEETGLWYKPIPYQNLTPKTEGVIYKPIQWI